MTDNEIIKAFTVCTTSEDCSLCHMFRNCPTSFELQKQALELIKRQQAEIEMLKKENNQFAEIGKLYSEIKAEAYKEFAEKVKQKTLAMVFSSDVLSLEDYCECIDNLVKEMVGESNEREPD